MKRREKGSMTVFLSMILWMVLALILALLESARMQAARAGLQAQANLGMFSLFGEYDRDLLEAYDLFFLDMGGQNGTLQTDACAERLEYYSGTVQESSWVGLSGHKALLSAVMLAADHDGAPFVSQAASYIKGNALLNFFTEETSVSGQKFLEEGGQLLEESGTISSWIEEIRQAAKEQAEKEAEENKEAADVSHLEFENPIHTLKRLMEMGITGIAGVPVSETSTDLSKFMSNRISVSGWGDFENCPTAGTAEYVLLNAYILEKFPCLTSEEGKQGSALKYQSEYVISGLGSDQENLEAVLKKLLTIRFGADFSALLASPSCVAKAEQFALTISAAAGLPVLEPVMKTAVLLLWALEESMVDVRTLCSGGKVELLKSAEEFTCSLEGLFSFQITEGKECPNGWGYEDYLKLLLLTVNAKSKTYRCMDMIEHTIRENYNRPFFYMDMQAFAMKAEISAGIKPIFLSALWKGGGLSACVSGSYDTY